MSELNGLEIAVLAVAGRFPGAASVEELWRRLRAGDDLIARSNDEELRASGISDAELADPDFIKAFGRLADPDLFDAAFFDITPRDAELVDPQHRLLLEVAWEALERAGYDSRRLRGAPIGVFAGCNSNTYFIQQILPALTATEAVYLSPGFGHDKDHLTSLLAYKLGLEGPAVTVQAACSTGLVATHLACQALLNGECDLCLAGASSVVFPQVGYLARGTGFVSRQGRCCAFDHRADGTVPANGVGVVVLKRLDDALADRDPILAVIKGSAIGNDGADRSGYTAPRLDGQAKVVRSAQLLAEVDPATLGYVEAHGSATALGDPVEVAALTRAFRAATEQTGFCALGSIKSNCGHTGTAAGISGLIKTVLALRHAQIPPSLHFEQANPEIDFATSPFFVNTEPRSWPQNGGPRRAAVTSLGLGGANAHLILEEAPPRKPSGPSRPAQLLLLSARTRKALEAQGEQLAARLASHGDEPLADVAYTLALGRRCFAERRIVVCRDAESAVATLAEAPRTWTATASPSPPSVAFLLPGLGDHQPGLGRRLYDSEAIFRDTIDHCAAVLEPILGEDLRTVLFTAPETEGRARRLFDRGTAAPSLPTRLGHPALFSVEVALARLWQSWGVRPRALLGYSLGELTAACLAEVFSLDDGLRVVAARARAIEALPGGAMLAVALGPKELGPWLGNGVTVAAESASELTVVAGSVEAIAELETRLGDADVVFRRVATGHAFHSPLMAGAVEPLLAALATVELRAPKVPFLSNVTGAWIRPEEAVDPDYWGRQLVSPVRLDAALGELFESEPGGAWLEVGPGQALSSLALQHDGMHGPEPAPVVVPSFAAEDGPERETDALLTALGKLWLAGVEPDFTAFYAGQDRQRLTLPTYPFERRRFWFEPPAARTAPRSLPRAADDAVEPAASTAPQAISLDGIEGRIAELWREVLGVEQVERDDHFFELGGHSLAGLRVTSRLGRELGIELPLRALFESPTVSGLAAVVRRLVPSAPESGPRPVARRPGEPAVLSFAQERLWFLARLAPESAAYNIPSPVRLRGRLDRRALARALGTILRRHETLRTRFVELDDEPRQVVEPSSSLLLPFVDLSALDAADREAEARRRVEEEATWPFDLERGPLLRVTLLRLDAEEHVALLTVHHIISDGWSMGVLIGEMATLYQALSQGEEPSLPALPLQYADFAVWQKGAFADGRMAEQLDYWRQRLDAVPRLELPRDRPRPAAHSFAGARARLRLPPSLTAALEELARQRSATLFMALLTAVEVWLWRLTGERDVAVGTPIAGRREPTVEPLIGFFVNTLVLRGEVSRSLDFAASIDRVQELVLAAFAHQDLPFEKLVEELQPERDLARTPFFDVMFVLQNVPFTARELPELRLEAFGAETQSAKFDLTLSLWQDAEGGLVGRAEYSRDLFDATTIERWLGAFERLCRGLVESPGAPLAAVPWLSSGERHQLLVELNDTAAYFAGPAVLPRLIETQARRTPDAVAVVAALDGGDMASSYAVLDARANRLARGLARCGVERRVVALELERSPELLLAALAVMKAGAAYLPLDPAHPRTRRDLLVADAEAVLVLSEEPDSTSSRLDPWSPELWDVDGTVLETAPEPEDLAYVIYTSGSTGQPKGVMVSHAAITNRLKAEAALGGGDRVLQRSASGFDVSVRELFWPLLHGAATVMPAAEEAVVPARLLLEQRITVASFVPSLLEVLLAEPELDGVALRHVIASGEVLRRELVERFHDRLPGVELSNRYGPTEAAIGVSVHLCGDETGLSVPIGRGVANTRLLVLDAELRPEAMAVAGELTIAGVQLARGYLGRPARTALSFMPDPFSPLPSGRLYRTGDLARRNRDGELEFLGRVDQQLKVRGIRLEPGEIESVLRGHPRVRSAAVVLAPGGARLVAFVAADEGLDEEELRRFARTRLPVALVPWRFPRLDELPLLRSGKVDRRSLEGAAASLSEDGSVDGARVEQPALHTPSEELLAAIWRELLAARAVARTDDFFALGGHSLLATRLLSQIRQVFAVELPLRTVFEAPVLVDLAARVDEALAVGTTAALPPIVPVERRGRLPLSFAQQRLWLLDRLAPNNPFYNMASSVRLLGRLDVAGLFAAWRAVGERHESLRTTFPEADGKPFQHIASDFAGVAALVDLADLSDADRRAALAEAVARFKERPFELVRGPLCRLLLARFSDDDHTVLLTLHHIISDGWSMGLLHRDLAAFYEAAGEVEKVASVPSLPVQYPDFAVWQRRWLDGDELASQLAFWRRQLAGLPPSLELPWDRPRPLVASFRGRSLGFVIGAELRGRLERLAVASRATLAMTLLTGFKGLLYRLSEQDDLAVGIGIANRRRIELENLIGFFVNTLVLRAPLKRPRRAAFTELLAGVRDASLAAYAHQDLPFERLVEELDPERDLSRNPLVQVMFGYQNYPHARFVVRGLEFAVPPATAADHGTSKFDLTLFVYEEDEGLRGQLEYNSDLFDATTVERLVGHLVALLDAAAEAPETPLAVLDGLSAAQRHQLFCELQAGADAAGRSWSREVGLAELFARQVARRPDALAVIEGGACWSYGELDRQAARVAGALRGIGVARESCVGLLAERSAGHLIGLLGIVQAGGVYVPLDRDYPIERLAFMARDAELVALVGEAASLQGWSEFALSEGTDGKKEQLIEATSHPSVSSDSRPHRGLSVKPGAGHAALGAAGEPQVSDSDFPRSEGAEPRVDDRQDACAPSGRGNLGDRQPGAHAASLRSASPAPGYTLAPRRGAPKRSQESSATPPASLIGLIPSSGSPATPPSSVVGDVSSSGGSPTPSVGGGWNAGELGGALGSLPVVTVPPRLGSVENSSPSPAMERGLGGEDNLGSSEKKVANREDPTVASSGDDLAYVMYTSGSTGRPKGVAVTQRAVSRLAVDTSYLSLAPHERMAQIASPSFDAATWEIWVPLLSGAAVVVLDKETVLEPRSLGRALREQRITAAFLTTSLFNRVATEDATVFSPLRQLFFGGEAGDPQAVAKVLGEAGPGAFTGRLVNGYGPTESTTFATVQVCDRALLASGIPRLPIGRPIDYTRLFILDRQLHPVLPGAPGELCLGGDGLARGYHRRPALTANAFFPDPFSREGERLYHTGDRARLRADGAVEFLGRFDGQVKLRGFRLELAEIEAAASEHPWVAACVVGLLRRGEESRLVAWVVPRDVSVDDEQATFQTTDWEEVFDDLYSDEEGALRRQPTFDTVGWNSTYTGEPLPAAEMREWLDDTVSRLRALILDGDDPPRLLELGCGTGMLLFELAPSCAAYWGTDVSGHVLSELAERTQELPGVQLMKRPAWRFEGLEEERFDLVVLNSVAQYFPDLGHLATVLDRAAEVLRPGGTIFVGDVRNLPLLGAFHAGVELFQAAPETPVAVLRQRLAERRARENELVVDPAFFVTWAERNGGFRVVVLAKRGQARNEMSAYRYQVVLRRVEGEDAEPPPIDFLAWEKTGSLDALRRRLIDGPERLGLTGIPNARVASDVAALDLLATLNPTTPASTVLHEAATTSAGAVDPEALCRLGEELGYRVELGAGRPGETGSFDAVFVRSELADTVSNAFLVPSPLPAEKKGASWRDSGLANDPLQGRVARQLATELRRFLAARLPEVMVPSSVVRLASLPLTPNGKLDRDALPEPDARTTTGAVQTAPRDELEATIAAIWQEVLGLERLGIEDDFFALGGHSLLATQVVSRLRQALMLEIPLRVLFEAPTVAGLAARVVDLRRAAGSVDAPPLVAQPRRGDLPLSFAQERLWFLDRLEPGAGRYHEAAAVRLVGELDAAALRFALEHVVQRHETLRTTFAVRDGRPVQIIAETGPAVLQVVDLEALPSSARDAVTRSLSDAVRRFDLVDGPLFRVLLVPHGTDVHVVLFGFHHIVFDGWSIAVFLRELSAGYRAARTRRDPELPPLQVQYADFAAWQRRWLSDKVLAEQLAWWRDQLTGVPSLELPTDRPRGRLALAEGGALAWRLEPRLAARLESLAQSRGATLFMALLAVLEVLLWRLSGQRDLTVGTPIANRNRLETEGLIGFFVNMLVLRAELAPRSSFTALLERVRTLTVEAYTRQDVPFEKLVEELQPERRLDRSPLFQVAFQLLELPAAELALPGLRSEPFSLFRRTSKFDLSLNLSQGAETVAGRADYRADLFDRTTVERWLTAFATLIEGVVDDSERPIAALELLTQGQRHQLLREAQGRVDPSPRSLLAPWLEHAARRSAAIAVIDGEAVLSFGELRARSSRLAGELGARGVGTDVVVGVHLERSAVSVIAFLAVLQSGGTYLPLPRDLPRDRLAFMLADASPAWVLAAPSDALPGKTPVLAVDKSGMTVDTGTAKSVDVARDPLAAAYVLYTSGSTGWPKGIVVHDAALANHMRWYAEICPMGSDDALLHKTPSSFDVAVGELLAPLLAGARLVLAPPDSHRNPSLLMHALVEERITVLHVVPSLLRLLVRGWQGSAESMAGDREGACAPSGRGDFSDRQPGAHAASLRSASPAPGYTLAPRRGAESQTSTESSFSGNAVVRTELADSPPRAKDPGYTLVSLRDAKPLFTPVGVTEGSGAANRQGIQPLAGRPGAERSQNAMSLRALFCGGELLPSPLAKEALDRLAAIAPSCTLINVYGPAEAAIRATWQVAAPTSLASIPIGRPISNLQALVLSHALTLAPLGVAGELHLGGDGPGRGYLRRPALTAERFLPDPWSDRLGACLYRTGDRVRRHPDGTLEALGRLDHQVKVRGVRLELGEVESALREHPELEEAVVLLLGDGDDARLVAGVVPKRRRDGSSRPQVDDLRVYLLRRLPETLVPASFAVLEALPLSSHGKVDRWAAARALEATARADSVTPRRSPRDPLELELVRLWEEVLGVEGLGIDDDFFALGGHSLLAVHLVDRIAARWGRSLPLSVLFEGASPASLARHLRGATGSFPSGGSLVAFRAAGELAPLFLVHPIGGDVLAYRELAAALGKEQPVYAFRAPGLAPGEEPLRRIEDLAARYVAEALAVWEGPFHLAGWSFGGTVAFEMARQLNEKGREVAPVLIFDGRAERPSAVLSAEDPRFWLTFAEQLGLSRAVVEEQAAVFARQGDEERLTALLTSLREAGLLPPEVGVEALRSRRAVLAAHFEAAARYDPRPAALGVELFQAGERLDGGGEDLAPGWQRLAELGVGASIVAGDHHTLVRGEGARQLARSIRRLSSSSSRTASEEKLEEKDASPASGSALRSSQPV